MKFESLIFDIDGTLWDSRALVAEGYNLQLQSEGLGHLCTNAEALKALFGKTMQEIGDLMFGSIPAPERYELMERCMDRENRYLAENECNIGYPGVKETLEKLAENHRLFIVSNSQKGYPQLCMEKMGIGHLFSGHLCFGDSGTEKGLTIRTLMKEHDIQDACYIGDTAGDETASDVAGLPFVFCKFGFGTATHPIASIDTFSDLLHILD